jgi:hypothetical protein
VFFIEGRARDLPLLGLQELEIELEIGLAFALAGSWWGLVVAIGAGDEAEMRHSVVNESTPHKAGLLDLRFYWSLDAPIASFCREKIFLMVSFELFS